MYEALSALQDGVTVITSTRRLARTLGRQYDRWQAQRGRRAWPRARAWQWSDWLEQLWLSMHLSEAGESPMLLNRLQEHTLWEQAIQDTPEARELLQPSDIARAAHTAWDGRVNAPFIATNIKPLKPGINCCRSLPLCPACCPR